MKKFLALLLPLIIVLTLIGCVDHHTPSTDPTDAPTILTTDPIGNATDGTKEPSHIHEYQISDTIGASCTEGGYTVYVCACGDTYQADETDALGHSFGEWITIKEPTEAEEGEAKHICSVCGAEETRTLSKLIPDHTHSYAEEITKAATCTEEGSVTYTCACGDTYSESTPKTAHDYTDSVTAATCTNGGYTTHTCTACGYSYVDERTDATGHSWGEWVTTQEPTTTSTGTAERTCSNCGTKETKTLDKLIENHTHSYTEEVTQKPTCTEDGVKTLTCSCGAFYTESISKLGHDYVSSVTKPTCTKDGYTTHTCTRCNDSYTDNKTSATGHNYTSKVTKAATCTETGVRTYTCSKCSHSYTETISKKSHEYNSVVTPPTCTEQGYTTYTCKNCSHSYIGSIKAATGHQNTTTTVADGYETVTCDDCGAIVSQTAVETEHVHAYERLPLPDAAMNAYNAGYWDYMKYTAYTDWTALQCTGCWRIDESSIKLAYTQMEAAQIMLDYVNDLREDVFGHSYYNLVIDETLVELANIRAKEISKNYSHYGGTWTNAGENIQASGVTIKRQFESWKGSAGHYEGMVMSHYEYFGYAIYWDPDYGAIYGVQLFWDESSRAYYKNHCG